MSPRQPSNSYECDVCGKNEIMLFKCNYCGGNFCSEHRLPENHYCTGTYREKGRWFRSSRADVRDIRPDVRKEKSRPSRSRINTRRITNWLRNSASWVLTISYVLFFSLPVGLAVIIEMAHLDPLTKLIFQKIINQIHLVALAYVLCTGYLLYQKLSREETFITYLILAGLSVGSTWMLLDKISVLLVLNYLVGGSQKAIPNIFDVYVLWTCVLLDTGLTLIRPIFQNYDPLRTFIDNTKRWIANRVKDII